MSVIITNEDHKELSLVCIMGYDNGSLCIWNLEVKGRRGRRTRYLYGKMVVAAFCSIAYHNFADASKFKHRGTVKWNGEGVSLLPA